MTEIKDLKHVEVKTSFGAEILFLNTGAVITAEDTAMLQALYSRDPKGVKSHLEKLARTGSGNLMANFYVGYGHQSIGDCGFTTMFMQNISMLAAKAIQDSQLYNGQECSTRYIDFSQQAFFDPINQSLNKNEITEKLRTFYVTNFPKLIESLKTQFKKPENEDEKIYNKAINARAFDILRGFLPAGATTGVAWTGTLRSIADRLKTLRHHPLAEVKEIASKTLEALQIAHPNSFGHKFYETTEKYNAEFMNKKYLLNDKSILVKNVKDDVKMVSNNVNKKWLKEYLGIINKRPAKTDMLKQIGIIGNSTFSFLLDFGSFRDFQRHRAILQLMPELTLKYGFEKWYLDQLPKDIKIEAEKLLKEIEKDIKKIEKENKKNVNFNAQYLIPMGYKVPIVFTGDIPSLVYLAEIRSSSTVHATLQKKAIQLAEILEKTFKTKVHYDKKDVGRFDIKRGKHDIVEKKK
jgi:thymidylate synthase ThyX